MESMKNDLKIRWQNYNDTPNTLAKIVPDYPIQFGYAGFLINPVFNTQDGC